MVREGSRDLRTFGVAEDGVEGKGVSLWGDDLE
jgi:hypothetical protein